MLTLGRRALCSHPDVRDVSRIRLLFDLKDKLRNSLESRGGGAPRRKQKLQPQRKGPAGTGPTATRHQWGWTEFEPQGRIPWPEALSSEQWEMVEESIRSHWHFESIAQDARKKGGWRVQRAEGWLHRTEPVGRMTERWRNRRL